MKITTLLMIVGCMQLSAASFSQTITLTVKARPLTDVFEAIQSQTELKVLYSDRFIRSKGAITATARQMPLEEFLSEILTPKGLASEIVENTILIKRLPRNHSPTSPNKIAAPNVRQERIITGKVTNEEGVPLPYVTIREKAGSRNSTSDENGYYSIAITENTTLLVFSLVGYKAQEIPIQQMKELDVVLVEGDQNLDEVVVVAFGTQKKLTTIGAQSSVAPKELKTPVRNLSTVLAGRIPGIVSVQRSGEPGYDNASLWIRGRANLTGGGNPLVLIDGVERPLEDVDPEDIESFSILKDASATAVYGVRGANGVVLINTRKGTAQKTVVTVGYNEGLSTFVRLPEFVDGPTYMAISNEAQHARGRAPIYSEEAIQATLDGSDPDLYPNINWIDELFSSYGSNSRLNLNMRGGSDVANFYVSGAYFSEEGLLKTDELQNYDSKLKVDRYNFTSNLSLKATSTTNVDFGVQGFILNGTYPGWGTTDIFARSYETSPVSHPKRYSNGLLSDLRGGSTYNPYLMLTQTGYNTRVRSRVNSNVKIDQRLDFLTEGLSVYGMFAFDYYNANAAKRSKSPDTWTATGRDDEGNLIMEQINVGSNYLSFSRGEQANNRRFYSEAALVYSRNVGNHNIGGLALFNQSDYLNSVANDVINSLPYRYRGVAGRITYDYSNRYLLEMNFGYNGSENFTPKNRYGFFPSIGLGWVFTEESFLPGIKDYLSLGKIRFSHGQAGNADIGGRRFAYMATIGTGAGGYTFGRDYNRAYSGKDIGEYGVDVTWEVSTKTNLGLDITSREGLLNFQLDFFKERREGAFLRRNSVPDYIGLQNNPYGNLGISENKGIDGSLTVRKAITANLSLNLQGTFTFSRNKVIDDDLPPWNYPWRERKGQRIDQRFGLLADGLFVDEADVRNSAFQTGDNRPGDIKYKDLNSDGVIDGNDEAPIGFTAIPEIVYGGRFGVDWKNFSLAAFFQGVGNVDILLSGEGVVPFDQGAGRGTILTAIEDRWSEDNPSADVAYPRLTVGNENMNYRTSDWWLRKGDYLRLKTLDLSYTFPERISNILRVKRTTIYFQGFNLLTFSSFKQWDVEIGSGRGNNYPQTTVYNLGAQISF